MIDWYVIEYLYPESFKKFIDTMYPNVGVISLSTLQHFDIKNLYYFFDKQGIYLTIETQGTHFFMYNISTDSGITFGNGFSCIFTREEIEINGFTECFKMLDKKLRYQNQKYL